MSARKSGCRRAAPLSPHKAYEDLQSAVVDLEGSAAIAFAAVEGIGNSDLQRESARYTADRLLQADVRSVRTALDALYRAMRAPQ